PRSRCARPGGTRSRTFPCRTDPRHERTTCMDPQIAWKDLRDAYAEKNLDDMQSSAADLMEWLDQGWFPPQTSSDPPMDEHWNRMVARAACHSVLHAVTLHRRTQP